MIFKLWIENRLDEISYTDPSAQKSQDYSGTNRCPHSDAKYAFNKKSDKQISALSNQN